MLKFIPLLLFQLVLYPLTFSQLLNQPAAYNLRSVPEPGGYLSVDPTQFINLSTDSTDFYEVWSAPVKVIVFLEGGCSMCGARFGGWKSLIDEKFHKWGVPVAVIAYDQSLPSLSYTALDNIKFNHPLFYDRVNSFFIENKISQNPELHAFLLDGDNTIRLIGSPVENRKWLPKYKKEIKKIRKGN